MNTDTTQPDGAQESAGDDDLRRRIASAESRIESAHRIIEDLVETARALSKEGATTTAVVTRVEVDATRALRAIDREPSLDVIRDRLTRGDLRAVRGPEDSGEGARKISAGPVSVDVPTAEDVANYGVALGKWGWKSVATLAALLFVLGVGFVWYQAVRNEGWVDRYLDNLDRRTSALERQADALESQAEQPSPVQITLPDGAVVEEPPDQRPGADPLGGTSPSDLTPQPQQP